MPTPTWTPVDVAAEFIRIITDAKFAATAEITGTMTIGDVEARVTGSLRGSGDKSDVALTTTALGTEQTRHTITIGATTWTQQGRGPLLKKEPAAAKTSLFEWLASLRTLDDLGLETRGGRSLHHLRPTAGAQIPPEVLGADPDTISEVSVTIDFYAEDDGTPAILFLEGSWTQDVGGVPIGVVFEFEYVLADIGEPQTIVRPTDVWEVFENPALGYSMAHPEGWTVESNAEGDEYRFEGIPFVFVYPNPGAAGMSLDQYQVALGESYEADLGVAAISVTPFALGGEAAKLALYRFIGTDGSALMLLDGFALHAGTGWEVFMITDDGPGSEADADLFARFIASFTFMD